MSIINVDFAPLLIKHLLFSDPSNGWIIAESDDYSYLWQKGPFFELPNVSGEAAAEEVFDIFNNPSRIADKQNLGLIGSVGVGDIITVDGIAFYCNSVGGKKLYDRNYD